MHYFFSSFDFLKFLKMYKSSIFLFSVLFVLVVGCGEKEEKKQDRFNYENTPSNESQKISESNHLASQKIDLKSKGIGPITSIELASSIDQDMAKKGQLLFNKMCTACHRPDKKFIGPEPKGIMNRRTPEWIMNMILNPEEMLRKDPLAKELLIEFNYAPMIKQDITPDDARAILEYYRTL